MDAFTARSWQAGEAPARIELLGDKTKRPEPAQHIIEFPGGAIELSRTSDGNYWAHILVNRDWAVSDVPGFRHCQGEVVASRLCHGGRSGVDPIPAEQDLCQLAVLIRPVLPKGGR